MSTESQAYSIENQKAVLTAYAKSHDYRVMKTYDDAGLSGISLRRRRALRQLLEDVISHRAGFKKILVYDVSRWGRFQDVDESAHYEFICKRAGVQVIYCAEQFVNDGTFTSDLMKAIKRTMAGEYSRELSSKVSRGQHRMAERGFWMHSRSPYGMRRMLISPDGKQKGLLRPAEHKFKSDRVKLVLGPKVEVRVVRQIFDEFIANSGKHDFGRMAKQINARGIKYQTGKPWTRNHIHQLLTNPVYIGLNVWGRKTKLLSGKIVYNSFEKWSKCKAFPAIIDDETFKKVQALIAVCRHRQTDAELLSALKDLYKQHGHLNRQIVVNGAVAGSSTYTSRFGSLIEAYKQAGYEIPKRFIASNQAQRDAWTEIQLLARRICSIFPTRVSISRKKECQAPILRLDNDRTVVIRTCRWNPTMAGRARWKATTWQRRLTGDLALIALYDTANEHLSTFYLTSYASLPRRFLYCRRDWPVLKNAIHLDDLFRFYEVAMRLCTTGASVSSDERTRKLTEVLDSLS